jgi:hypothetical protein
VPEERDGDLIHVVFHCEGDFLTPTLCGRRGFCALGAGRDRGGPAPHLTIAPTHARPRGGAI